MAARAFLLLVALAAQACIAVSGAADERPKPREADLEMREVASLSLPYIYWAKGMSALAFEAGADVPTAHVLTAHVLTVVNDTGRVSTLAVRYDSAGALAGVELLASTRAVIDEGARFRSMDFEAVVRTPEGDWLMSVEQPARLVTYAGPGIAAFNEKPAPWPAPHGLADQPENRGAEAMTLLPDGRALLIGEAVTDGVSPLWIGGPAGWATHDYASSPGFAPVEAVPHPCGGVLVLERAANFIRGLTARLVFIPERALAPDRESGLVVPDVIGMVEPTAGRGNYEGMAMLPAERPADGTRCPAAIEVLIASDDNSLRLLPRRLAHYRIAPRAADASR